MAKLATCFLALVLLLTVSAHKDNSILPNGRKSKAAISRTAWGGGAVECRPPNCCKYKCPCCREQLDKTKDAFIVPVGGKSSEENASGIAGGGAARGGGAHKDSDGEKSRTFGGVAGVGAAFGGGSNKDVDGGRSYVSVGGDTLNGGVRKDAHGGTSGVAGGGAAMDGHARKHASGGKTEAGFGGGRKDNVIMPGGKTEANSSAIGGEAAWGSGAVECKPPNCCQYKCSCCKELLKEP